MNPRFKFISTSTLRAMSIALEKSPWSRILRTFRIAVENELLARDLPAIAEQSGGWPCPLIEGMQ